MTKVRHRGTYSEQFVVPFSSKSHNLKSGKSNKFEKKSVTGEVLYVPELLNFYAVLIFRRSNQWQKKNREVTESTSGAGSGFLAKRKEKLKNNKEKLETFSRFCENSSKTQDEI